MKSIYFIRPIGAHGPVKIGCSKDPKGRAHTISIWSPVPLEIVAVAEGGHEYERALHERFAKDRMHGEWFAASSELTALIDSIAAGAALPRPVTRHRMNRDGLVALGEKIRPAYEAGCGLVEIAGAIGCSVSKTRKVLALVGCSIRPRGAPQTDAGVIDEGRAKEMARLYQSGLTLQAIGVKYGLTRERVRQILRKSGVPSRGWNNRRSLDPRRASFLRDLAA